MKQIAVKRKFFRQLNYLAFKNDCVRKAVVNYGRFTASPKPTRTLKESDYL